MALPLVRPQHLSPSEGGHLVVGHLEVLVVGVWAVAGCPRSEDKGKGKDKGKDWQPQELLQGLVQGRARDKARGVV